MMTSTEALREQRYERYFFHNCYEEMTNVSERMNAPVDTQDVYSREADGTLYDKDGVSLQSVLENGMMHSAAVSRVDPNFRLEAVRCVIEFEEGEALKSLRDGEMMFACSMIPDDIVSGKIKLDGYRTDKKRCYVRLFLRQGGIMHTRTMSLDQSDRDGIVALYDLFGEQLDLSLGSEAILAKRIRRMISFDDYQNLGDVLRDTYDSVLQKKFGGSWTAGVRDGEQRDAMSIIKSYPKLITEHMEVIDAIKRDQSLSIIDRDIKLEDQRRLIAAAIDIAMLGEEPDSIYDTHVMEHEAAYNFSGDCPITIGTPANQLAMNKGKSSLNVRECPICFAKYVTATVENGWISGSCGCAKEICGTGIINSQKRKTLRDKQPTSAKKESIARRHGAKMTRLADGKTVEVRNSITIGGTETAYYDMYNRKIEAQ